MATPFDPEEKPADQSRGEELLADLKRKHMAPGQFRMGSLFLIIILVSVVFAAPRMIGWHYDSFFVFLWLAAFAATPTISLIVALFVPRLRTSTRRWLAAASAVLTTMPLLIVARWMGETEEIIRVLLFTSLMFWAPQLVSIWCVWFFLFRKRKS